MSENKIDTIDYAELTDDELIVMSQAGDETALETVLVRYKPLVYKKSQPYYLAGGDSDDVVQEGLIGLYKAVISFDKSKFPFFNVFAGVCIERRIMSAVKKASRMKHNPLNTYVSLSGDDEESSVGVLCTPGAVGATTENPENILIEKERVSGLEGIISDTLSQFEMRVLLSHLNGRTYKETAKHLNRDVKAIDNAMQRIKKKLEAFSDGGI